MISQSRSHEDENIERPNNRPFEPSLVPRPVAVLLTPVIGIDPKDKQEKIGVLIIRRDSKVGDGGLALPGGFISGSDEWDKTAESKLMQKTGIVLPEDSQIRHFDTKSIPQSIDGESHLVVFGLTDAILESELSEFCPEYGALERLITYEPIDLVFPSHTTALKKYLDTRPALSSLATQAEQPAIVGSAFKELVTHHDQRGFFREIIRENDEFFSNSKFGQWSHSKMEEGVVKAWHYHHVQYDWWYVASGLVEAVLYDNREESETFGEKYVLRMGDSKKYHDASASCLCIPPGVLHGLKVLSEEADLLYVTSETYDPNDEGRMPFDCELVGHDWGDDVITNEKDRTHFIPRHVRTIKAM